jgi:PBP1b-binding outer membrane lipoprotein LpoB
MRVKKSALAVLAVAFLVAGCGQPPAPKPDTRGDAAFVTQLKQWCTATPTLATIDTSAGDASVTAAANTNLGLVTKLQTNIQTATPKLSNATPLAVPVTNLEEMLVDVELRYTFIVNNVKNDKPTALAKALAKAQPLALTRLAEAQSDLAKLGVQGCLK